MMLNLKSTVVLLAFALPFTAKAETVTQLKFIPASGQSKFAIYFDGNANFRVLENHNSNQVIIEGEGLQLPASLTRIIDGSAKAGPVMQITPYNSGGNKPYAKFVVQLRSGVRTKHEQSKGKFELDFVAKPGSTNVDLISNAKKTLPSGVKSWVSANGKQDNVWIEKDEMVTRASAVDKSTEVAKQLLETLDTPIEERTYKGGKISIELSEVDIHDIFRLVGEESGLNIITNEDVKAKVSLSMKDVPWDQALDIILQNNNLKASVLGNVVRVTTLATFNKEQEEKKKSLQIGSDLEPVIMAIIPLSYSKAEDMSKMVDALLIKNSGSSGGGGAPGAPPATSSSGGEAGTELVQAFVKGKIEVDQRSNSLIVTNTKDAIERIKRLVKELDIALPQVLIDSKIVVASEQFSKQLGVSFGGSATSTGSGRAGAGVSFNGGSVNLGNGEEGGNTPAFSITSGSDPTTGAFGFQLGSGLHGNLNLQLNLAELNGVSKTIGSPRLIVNNKQKAKISDGQRIATITPGSNNGPATTNFTEAALSLDVTPQITNSGSVLMDLKIKKDAPSPNGRDISSKEIETQVLVDSGSTLVLGGVYQFSTRNETQGIPLLKDLPFLGRLFRTDSESVAKDELLIFITPQILEAGIGTAEANAKAPM